MGSKGVKDWDFVRDENGNIQNIAAWIIFSGKEAAQNGNRISNLVIVRKNNR